MSRRISSCCPMGDPGCKNQTTVPPTGEEARRNIIEVGKLLLPKNPSKRDLKELLEMMCPDVARSAKMKKSILNQLKPDKILKMIFAYTLVAKGGAFVTPTVVTSNWCESYSEADYQISFPDSPYYNGYRSFESGSDVTLRKNVGPRSGIPDSAPYVELTRVLRPLIDATCLRTCKQIRELGLQISYADNAYSFKVKGNSMILYDSPPSLIFEDSNYH
ncbi:hypothetical protein BPAE_0024g00130 [Botrytis paeoniae]|uniref:Uncharacterized protein n=1 Tax=Botrytis paeoniae TaxID=278948 RepID=A0A4Z1FYD9_9HELO|nr:hypothetical protein BPAE_0024g00130 [Botrytis paeoniae]